MSAVVRSLLTDVRDTLFPGRGAKYGLLPPLLIGLTVITGLVDAFSYLTLGHVFVANMTGNVVFLAFGLVGVGGFTVVTSLVAIGAFILGALGGGLFRSRLSPRLRRQLAVATGTQLLLLVAGVILCAVAGGAIEGGLRYGLVAVLAVAMGIQNATARGLAVPDLTTTVLTMTITGIAADTRAAGGTGSRAGRRLISIAAMLGGAVVGAVLILRGQVIASLVVAVILLAVVAGGTRLAPAALES
ncbi:MAG: YoaK family protein [Candidatus Dormibacteria bacterium]|jgi:uncharacterized membrane protein YoaK (UPF0700 family)